MKQTRKVAPDGGWGWMACFGVSIVNLSTRSIEPSFGLLFGDLLTELNVGTAGASVVISALDVMMNFSGLFVGPLLKEFSYRKVAITGSILCTLGFALTAPAQSMVHILATYSVINGIGVGLATSAAFVALNHYFKHKRGQAVGLSMAGTALGMMIFPQLVRILLDAFDFRGSVLILSGVALHALLGSMLLQPAKWHLKEETIDVELQPVADMKTIEEDDEDVLPEMDALLTVKNSKNNLMRKNFSEVAMSTTHHPKNGGFPKRPTFPRNMSNMGLSSHVDKNSTGDVASVLRQRKQSVVSTISHFDFGGSHLQVSMNVGDSELEEYDQAIRRVSSQTGISNNFRKDSFIKMNPTSDELAKAEEAAKELPQKPGFFQRFADLMDVDLLKDPIYLNVLFGLSIFYVSEMNFKMVTPFFFDSLGYSRSDVAFCLSVTSSTDILARVVLPPIFDRINIRKRTVFLVSILFVALTRSIVAELTEWNHLMIALLVAQFFRGAALSNFTLTVSEYASLEKLPSAFGWHLVGKAVFVIALGPLIGAVRDWTGSYPICIHVQSVCILIGALAWIIEYTMVHIESKKIEAAI